MATSFPEDTQERRPRPIRNALIVAGLAFLVGALVMGWAFTRWAPVRQLIGTETAPGATPTTTTAVPAVPQVLAGLPPAPPPSASAAPATPGTPVILSAVDARVSEIEARIARVDLRAAAAGGNAGRAEGLLIAFAARRAIDRGAGLGYIEGQLRDRFGASQPGAVAAVIAAAQNPVTVATLRQTLDASAATLTGGGKDESWWSRASRTLSTLVVVRSESAGPSDPNDRIARARLMLDGGQVDGALAEVARLPGASQANGWMTAARRYVAAHQALDIIETTAIMPTPPGSLPTASN
jgi:hypothetical protein